MNRPLTKSAILQACGVLLGEREKSLRDAIHSLQLDLGSESKSTAGDKHETGRAMIQLELESLSRQENELKQLRAALHNEKDRFSLLTTDQGAFFIAIGLGKVLCEGEEVMVISAHSPLGKLLSASKAGQTVTFGAKNYQIRNVD